MTVAESMRTALVVLGNVRRALQWVFAYHGTGVIDSLAELSAEVAAYRARGGIQ